jgi:hypothetical protein
MLHALALKGPKRVALIDDITERFFVFVGNMLILIYLPSADTLVNVQFSTHELAATYLKA